MNREEASFILANIDRRVCDDELNEALDMAIKALEQEPCEDAIRRADAEALFRNARSKLNPSDYKTADEFNTRDLMLLNAEQFIHLLPSVRPQEPKTGHWIDDNENEIDAQYGRHLYRCSKCNEYADMFIGGTEDWWDLEKPNYCPNCGAKMIEPQERSGEE